MSEEVRLILLFILCIGFGFFIGVLSHPLIEITNNIESGNYTFDVGNNIKNIYNSTMCNQTNLINVDKLQEQCGATYLTHYGTSDEWFIFKRVCNIDNYCKYDYVKLTDCYKG